MHEDLSFCEGPITGVFDIKQPSELSQTQMDLFAENGYLAGIQILDDRQLDVLKAELEALIEPGQSKNPLFYEYHSNESTSSNDVLFHALGAWRVSPAFHDLLFHRAITVPAAQLLDGPVRFWHDQLFVKPAHDGGIVAWHQDYSYWTRTKPVAHLTCWIGLDDSTIENGCVHYVPGSHKWDLLPRGSLADDMDAVLERLTDEQRDGFKPVAVELKAGQASFHHPMMVHGSYANRSSLPRRAVVLNFLRDGVMSDTDEPLLSGVPVIAKGNKMEGRFFPLLDAVV
jgi:ectoine hydroxylase-related dioxygenase (phytanoyl-CoA dioxygenase family)